MIALAIHTLRQFESWNSVAGRPAAPQTLRLAVLGPGGTGKSWVTRPFSRWFGSGATENQVAALRLPRPAAPRRWSAAARFTGVSRTFACPTWPRGHSQRRGRRC